MGNLCCSSSSQDTKVIQNSTRSDAKSHSDGTTIRGSKILQSGAYQVDSEGTIFFDAIDRFPSQEDMFYPPAHTMRLSLSLNEVDMEQPGTLPILLSNPSLGSIEEVDGQQPQRRSVAAISKHLSSETPGSQGSGYPGELTESDLETCLKFREELKKRDPAFKEMVMSMHPYEHEAFALCRYLRARDFVIEDVFAMLTEKNQPQSWSIARDAGFYEDFHNTIPEFNGCPLPVFLTQFPLIHSGIGKNGAIVLYFKAGEVNCPGIECIAGDMVNALPVAWNRLYHGARNAMKREVARADPSTTTVLGEKIIVVDLAGDSALFSSGLDFLKAAPAAGSCFPETVNRTYVLNAPFSFSIAWAVIKQLIDPRTVQKIGFFSTIAKATSDFLKYIESEDLLSTYGGTGESFEEILAKRQKELTHKEGIARYVVKQLTTAGNEICFGFDLSEEETVDSIVVYSRSDNVCEISVVDSNGNEVVKETEVRRENATNSNTAEDISRNNYAMEIATSEDFAQTPAGSFVVNTKSGKKGDHYLVAVTVAEKQ
ncbi:unnamed protein product [Pseudo-nitzschia multistriata]|uniref:CRAL-TRIO domain-containing protein n=1 Tax=Pseudo-nitzschia multistriata TaxID=183589 RepID=A0A448YWW0_9STRA|nr:unnamed protein product [Pseudo-nitzschia multistriata]